MTHLSVNINKVALLRNSRGNDQPNLISVSRTILNTGVRGITVHPRPDARHIQAQDVRDLRRLLREYPGRELNVEGNPFHTAQADSQYPGFLDLVEETQPDQVTLVPDDPHQLTSNHGWDISRDYLHLKPIIHRLCQLKQANPNFRISLFMDPYTDLETFKLVREIGSERIELYTDDYAKLYQEGRKEKATSPYHQAGEAARQAGLQVNAGHALSLDNLQYLIRELPYIEEVSIGHALICEALMEGLIPVIERYLKILDPSQE